MVVRFMCILYLNISSFDMFYCVVRHLWVFYWLDLVSGSISFKEKVLAFLFSFLLLFVM